MTGIYTARLKTSENKTCGCNESNGNGPEHCHLIYPYQTAHITDRVRGKNICETILHVPNAIRLYLSLLLQCKATIPETGQCIEERQQIVHISGRTVQNRLK